LLLVGTLSSAVVRRVDDGNSDNSDACLDTCVSVRCGAVRCGAVVAGCRAFSAKSTHTQVHTNAGTTVLCSNEGLVAAEPLHHKRTLLL
jgi:hypothetical protein